MGIQQLTPASEIEKYIEQWQIRAQKQLIYNLSYVGERVVNIARRTNSYKDQTGNLRSSIGYIIAQDGRVKSMSDFSSVKNGAEGSQSGKAYARELIAEYSQGICLIVVAGRNYASYVSNRGYDVLDSAELLADRLVPKLLKQLGLTY